MKCTNQIVKAVSTGPQLELDSTSVREGAL